MWFNFDILDRYRWSNISKFFKRRGQIFLGQVWTLTNKLLFMNVEILERYSRRNLFRKLLPNIAKILQKKNCNCLLASAEVKNRFQFSVDHEHKIFFNWQTKAVWSRCTNLNLIAVIFLVFDNFLWTCVVCGSLQNFQKSCWNYFNYKK